MARKPRYKLPDQEQVAAWLAATPAWQPWRWEGPVRAFLRQLLCLQGCAWRKADEGARVWESREWEICDRPFLPRRPDHFYCSCNCRSRALYIQRRLEGQPERGPRRCVFCEVVLQDDVRGKFCSVKCCHAAYRARRRAVQLTDRELHYEEQPRICKQCGGPIDPEADPRKELCTQDCLAAWFAAKRAAERGAVLAAMGPRICAAPRCTNPVPTDNPRAMYCCDACKAAAHRARLNGANGHAPPNGHAAHEDAERPAARPRPDPARSAHRDSAGSATAGPGAD